MKRRSHFIVLSIAAMLLVFSGCAKKPPAGENPSGSGGQENAVTFQDALSHSVTVSSPKKVVALMGSYAELWQIAGGSLSGVTEDAVTERGLSFPETVEQLGSYKTPSLEKIIALSPDFVILSADTDEHVALYDTLSRANIPCAYFHMDTFSEYLDILKIFTDITGRKDLYEQNGLTVKRQVDGAIESAKGKKSPGVLFIRTFSSGYRAQSSESMTGAILKDLGADNIADREKNLLKDLSLEAIIAADPDFIFVITMGADSEKALAVLKEGLQENPAWEGLSAVKNNRYFVLPRELFHYKPNARWGESYETLANILYGQN